MLHKFLLLKVKLFFYLSSIFKDLRFSSFHQPPPTVETTTTTTTTSIAVEETTFIDVDGYYYVPEIDYEEQVWKGSPDPIRF